MPHDAPFTRDRLRMILFNILNPIWPHGLRVYVQDPTHIAATLAEELIQACLGGPNAIEQLALIDKPNALRATRELTGYYDRRELGLAIEDLFNTRALVYEPTGDGLLAAHGQQLVGYRVKVNRDV